MSLTNPNKLITEQDLNDFYTKILPYLGGSSVLNYSTDEQVVGTWIDGKPLYQKTYTGLNTGNAYKIETPILLDDTKSFDKAFLDVSMSFFNPEDGSTNTSINANPINLWYSGGTSKLEMSVQLYVDLSSHYLYYFVQNNAENNATAWKNRNLVLTVRYTKTTD